MTASYTTSSEVDMDLAQRYLLLRRLEERLKQDDAPKTAELAQEFGVSRRAMCRYLGVLQTADEFRLCLVQEGWRWELLR